MDTRLRSTRGQDSPYINRFLSADTIVPDYANPQSLNRYAYVLNNPVRYTDPTGHCAEADLGVCMSVKQVTKREKIEKLKKKDKGCGPQKLPPFGENACSGSSRSIICNDSTYLGSFYAVTNNSYPITVTPISADDHQLADLTKSPEVSLGLLLHDIFTIPLGSDWQARRQNQYIYGTVRYERHQNEIGNYPLIKEISIVNGTHNNILLTSLKSGSYEFPFIAKPLIGPGQSETIGLPPHVSFSVTMYTEDRWTKIAPLVANIPYGP